MREFSTAVTAHDDSEDVVTSPVTFKIDGREVTFRGATSSEVFMLMAAVSDTSSLGESIATSINVLYELMEDNDRRWLKRRLFDRSDPMNPEQIAEYIHGLVEEWSARPTESPSDSLESSPPSGSGSTAKPRSKGKKSSVSA